MTGSQLLERLLADYLNLSSPKFQSEEAPLFEKLAQPLFDADQLLLREAPLEARDLAAIVQIQDLRLLGMAISAIEVAAKFTLLVGDDFFG